MRPDLMMRCSLPVVMAGIVGLYGLITNIIMISSRMLLFERVFSFLGLSERQV